MRKRHTNLPTMSITFDTCSSTVTAVPVLTLWRRHPHIVPCSTNTILTQQSFSTYNPLLINSKILPQTILHTSNNVRKCHPSTPYHNKGSMWEKLMTTECVVVWYLPPSEMHQKMSDFPTLDSHSVHKLMRTRHMKLVHRCLDMIRIYSLTVCVLNFRMGCWTTVNYVTALYLLIVWDLIASLNIPMQTKGSCLNLISSGFNVWRVKGMTSISSSKAEFLLSLYYTLAGLHRLRSSNVRSAYQPEK